MAKASSGSNDGFISMSDKAQMAKASGLLKFDDKIESECAWLN